MKRSWKIGIAASIVILALIVGIVVVGKTDKRREALEELEEFFTVSEEDIVNRYLPYEEFCDLFYEKDMNATGEFYTDIAGITVKAGTEGIVDKSEKLAAGSVEIGLGGMPFAVFDGYSDDSYLYLNSEIFGDKLLKLNYKEDLYAEGEWLGLERRSVDIIQKSYSEFFGQMVSSHKYERLEEILKNKEIKEWLLKIYDTMVVKEQKNSEEKDGGSIYRINFKAAEVKGLLEEVSRQYPELEEEGYIEIIEKFVSEEKGIEILEKLNEENRVTEVLMENQESGYRMLFMQEESEKGEKNGFDSKFSVDISQKEREILNAELTCSYNAEESWLEIVGKEEKSKMQASLRGKIRMDEKKAKVSMEIKDMTVVCGKRDISLYGSTEIMFGEYPAELPKKKEIDILHAENKELNEIENDLLQGIKGIVGNDFKKLLRLIGMH